MRTEISILCDSEASERFVVRGSEKEAHSKRDEAGLDKGQFPEVFGHLVPVVASKETLYCRCDTVHQVFVARVIQTLEDGPDIPVDV